MAISQSSRGSGYLALAVAICFLIPGCFCNKISLEIFDRACHCFDDHNVYNECAEELRLSVEGVFHVAKDSVDEYCGGSCFTETKLALQCVEGIADDGFRFSNGATVPAVREALGTGCSYTPERGIFEIPIHTREECGEEYYHHPQEQPGLPGYGEEGEQQGLSGYGEVQHYQGGAFGDFCSGAAGRVTIFSLAQMLLLLFLLVV